MPLSLAESRPFAPGTTGWSALDLDEPEIERLWSAGRFEIVEGVLTTMPPAYFIGGLAVTRVMHRVLLHVGEEMGGFATELEIVVDEARVARSDAAFMTPADLLRQREATAAAGKSDPHRTRILVPPTLIIECVSPGHERHDERTKRRWYAEFGVPNYWLLNPFKQTLKCLVLRNGNYEDDAGGKGNEDIKPALFPGLSLKLGELWRE